jgi:SAM-dependent methyltransferase
VVDCLVKPVVMMLEALETERMSPVSFATSYGRMTWNAPLSQDHAGALLAELDLAPGQSVLDLGCGWGELLLRVVEAAGDGASGVGVDTDAAALERGRETARERAIDSVTFEDGDIATWRGDADRVVCVGAAHAWGGAQAALALLGSSLRPGGLLLFGDGCWERPPTAAAAEIFDDVLALADLVQVAIALGWHVLHLSTADQREWDVFEATWRRGRQDWLMAHPEEADHGEVLDRVQDQLRDYVGTYRGVLGFAYLVLGRDLPPSR